MDGPHIDIPGGRGIIRSKFIDGHYIPFESLGQSINLPVDVAFPNHSPTVDPNEEFIIFVSKRPGGYCEQDLYISFKRSDETFGPAINLGKEINSIGTRNSWPQLSPDGEFLYFTSSNKPYISDGI